MIPENILTKAADGGAAREPDRPGLACRPTRCWTTSWTAWSSTRCRSPTSSRADIAPETVKKVERLLYLAEYKRRQAAPGVKISARNFGRDRRYPITNKFREDIGGR